VLTHREGVEFIIEGANRDFDPELVNIFLDLDRRGLLVADRSTQTDTTTPAVRRAEANPVFATGDQRLSPTPGRAGDRVSGP
jgi:hypothetical protein